MSILDNIEKKNDSVDYDVGATEIEAEVLDIASLDNDYLRHRAREIYNNNDDVDTEEKAIELARSTTDENTVDSSAMLSLVADRIYSSQEAPIREYIANAETACLRTKRNFEELHTSQRKSEYRPQIKITFEKDENRFTIQDNGIGISTQKMDKICGCVGHTDVLETGEMSGMWGMGMYSWFGDGFAGQDGSAIITTRSRETDEHYSILFELGGKNSANGELPDGVYGTKVSGCVNNEFDIRNAVKKYAEWSRVKVVYEEYDEDGKPCYDEEWGRKTLNDVNEDHNLALEIDNEAFRAVCSPDATERTLLVSMSIGRNDRIGTNSYDAPFKFDVRIKQEGGQIANGWARGLVPISSEKYEELPEEKRDNYVNEDWLDKHDAFFGYDYVTLPKPTPDRERLNEKQSQEFMRWLGGQFEEMFKNEVNNFFNGISTVDDIKSLDTEGMNILGTARRKTGYRKNLNDEYDAGLTDDALDYIDKMTDKVSLASRNRRANRVTKKKYRSKTKISDVISMSGDGGQVYMQQRLNKRKLKVVWAMHENNQVVQVNSNKYDEFEELFGWKTLSEISLSSLDEYDIPDDVKDEVRRSSSSGSTSGRESRQGKNVGEKKINISVEYQHDGRKKVKVDDVEDLLSDDGVVFSSMSRYDKVNYLVLFPTSSDESHTENYNLAGSTPVYDGYTAVASCTNEIYDYVKDIDGVMTKDEYIGMFDNFPLRTFDGSVTTLKKVINDDNAKILRVSSSNWETLNEDVMEENNFLEYYEERAEFEINDDDCLIIGNTGTISDIVRINGYGNIEDVAETHKIDVSRCVDAFIVDEVYFPEWDKDEYPDSVSGIKRNSYSSDDYYDIGNEVAMYKNLHDRGFDPEDITDTSWEVDKL